MEKTPYSWEVVFVDDGSTDTTFEILKEPCEQEERIRVAQLRRNFGQTAAMSAGFNHVLSRRLPSQIANWLISIITRVHLHDYGCTLKALRRDIAKELKLYGEMHRFIPALAADLGAKIIEVPVSHHARQHGRSQYGISRIVRVILDLITVKFLSKYSTRPSHLFGLCGLVAMLGGLGICGILGIQRLFFQTSLADRPLLLLGVVLLIVGVQFITMGLLGELLSRAYHEGQGKLVYVIKEIVNSSQYGTPGEQEPDSRADGVFPPRISPFIARKGARTRG